MAAWLFSVKSYGHSTDMYEPGKYGVNVKPDQRQHGLVFASYQRLLKARNMMDFDDHLSKACPPLSASLL